MEISLTPHLRPLLLLHPSISLSCWQKYINRDTLALKFFPQQLLSQTLYWIIEPRIYMTNGVNRLAFGLHPYPNTLCLLRKSKYKSVPRHVQISIFLQISSDVSRHRSYCSGYRNFSVFSVFEQNQLTSLSLDCAQFKTFVCLLSDLTHVFTQLCKRRCDEGCYASDMSDF